MYLYSVSEKVQYTDNKNILEIFDNGILNQL